MEAGDFSFTFESVTRGHHIYKSVWTPFIGETLSLAIEDGNAEDPYVVAVMKGTTIIGHTPVRYLGCSHFPYNTMVPSVPRCLVIEGRSSLSIHTTKQAEVYH